MGAEKLRWGWGGNDGEAKVGSKNRTTAKR